MTTYSYSLVLNDGERIALEAALDMLVKRCDLELAHGPKAPNLAWKRNALEITSRLCRSARQTSGSDVDGRTGLRTIGIDPLGKGPCDGEQ